MVTKVVSLEMKSFLAGKHFWSENFNFQTEQGSNQKVNLKYVHYNNVALLWALRLQRGKKINK